MKALFRNHFPFVELPESELSEEQKLIKKTYDKLYPSDSIPVASDSTEKSGSNTDAKAKKDRLREVHIDEQRTEGQ